jgi:hypothetical protein
MTLPFVYPSTPLQRRHGPQGYADYASYRPWLRDEFTFRCVYCLLREQWGRLRGTFDIDHFLPVAQYPAKVCDYDNLLHACATCNLAKGNRVLPDPLTVLTSATVRVAEDGTIHTDDPEAAQLIEMLGLDSEESTEFRLLWIGIVALAARHDTALYERLLSLPDDLRDLGRLRPPGGNTRPKGVDTSYFRLRERGQLPATY